MNKIVWKLKEHRNCYFDSETKLITHQVHYFMCTFRRIEITYKYDFNKRLAFLKLRYIRAFISFKLKIN